MKNHNWFEKIFGESKVEQGFTVAATTIFIVLVVKIIMEAIRG